MPVDDILLEAEEKMIKSEEVVVHEFAGVRTLVAPKTYLAGREGLLDDAAGEFDWWRGAWKHKLLGRKESPVKIVVRTPDADGCGVRGAR